MFLFAVAPSLTPEVETSTEISTEESATTILLPNASETSQVTGNKDKSFLIVNIRCTHEVCKQTYSWGASAPLP